MIDSTYTEQVHDTDAVCPYCGDSYQVEAEDYTEEKREIDCDACGRSYWLCQSFDVTSFSEPDCKLNGQTHKWELIQLRDGSSHEFCSVCDACKGHND